MHTRENVTVMRVNTRRRRKHEKISKKVWERKKIGKELEEEI